MRMLTTTVAAVIAGLLIPACASGAGEAAGAAEDDPQAAMLEFTECMREHGVDMPDPRGDGGGGGVAVELPEGIDPQSGTFKAAEAECRPILDEAMGNLDEGLDPQDRARMQEAMLEFAECMREQGIDFPDPQTRGGMVEIGPGEGTDPDDPALRDATERCRDHLPEMDGAPGAEGEQP